MHLVDHLHLVVPPPVQVFNQKIPLLFEKKLPFDFEFCILWLAGRQNYLIKQHFPDWEMLQKEKIIIKKSEITKKGNERYEDEFPDTGNQFPNQYTVPDC